MSNKYFYIGVKLLGDGNEKDTILEVFIFETTQQLTQLEDIALQTETENSIQGQINEVFRIVHTMKGSSAFMNYEKIVELTHSLEDVFYFIRENRPEAVDYSLLADIILKSIDFIKLEIACIQLGEASDFDVTELVNK
jgi:two-component system chemotaxis sensor kinase CheA